MQVLNYGTRYLFTKDYITESRDYRVGTICNILNNVVVLGKNDAFLFDVNSRLANTFGIVVKE